jgi:alpha-tubulin suppressor-like RCC1 family protein
MLTPALSGDPVSVCVGYSHTCILDNNQNVACTGRDQYGQIGVGASAVQVNVLTLTTGVSSVAYLACGRDAVFATTTTGALWAWGKNAYYQLGFGNSGDRWEAAEVSIFVVCCFLFFFSN